MNASVLVSVAVATASCAVAALVVATDGALLAAEPDAPLSPPVASALARRERVHAALSFARLLAFLSAGAAVGYLLRDPRPGAPLLAALFCVVSVAVCEGAARAAGSARHDQALVALAPVARVADALFGPIGWASARLDARLSRLVPVPLQNDDTRDAAAEQFLRVVAAEAEVSSQGEALLEGVFSLGETEVHEVMVPRVRVVGVERSTPWSEVVDRVRSSGHARYLVYEGTLDEVVGVLYAKDLLGPVLDAREPESGWPALARPATFIPATKTIDDQLREFRASSSHLAVVVDEYGGTAGLVTIEDVLEEIVGEIRDEHDEEEPEFVRGMDPSHFWASGRMLIEDLSEEARYDFPTEDVTTVGGLVYEALGRVPRAGESFVLGPFRVVVERVIRRRIERVYFERVEPLDDSTDA
jgi:CBS domain containing-hemolysin-like protein